MASTLEVIPSTRFRWPLVAGAVLYTALVGSAQPAASRVELRGGWRADTYTLATGERYEVKGLIVFTATDWAVTFFVTPDGGEPVRASAEGGTYTLDGANLALTHQYNFSTGGALPGLPASPLRMTMRDGDGGTIERITVAVEADRLRLAFPSGNAMTFRRSSEF